MDDAYSVILWSLGLALAVLLVIVGINSWTTQAVHRSHNETTRFVAETHARTLTTLGQVSREVELQKYELIADVTLKLKDKDVYMHEREMCAAESGQRMELERTTVNATASLAMVETQCEAALKIAKEHAGVHLKELKLRDRGLRASFATDERIAAANTKLQEAQLRAIEHVAEVQAETTRYSADTQRSIEAGQLKANLEMHKRECSTRVQMTDARHRGEYRRSKLQAHVLHEQIRDGRRAREELVQHDRFVQEEETQRVKIRESSATMRAGLEFGGNLAAARFAPGMGVGLRTLGGVSSPSDACSAAAGSCQLGNTNMGSRYNHNSMYSDGGTTPVEDTARTYRSSRQGRTRAIITARDSTRRSSTDSSVNTEKQNESDSS